MQRTYVGIDLAAQPRSTAVAVLVEDGNRCRLDAVVLGAEDQELIAAVRGGRRRQGSMCRWDGRDGSSI